jgi:hypothetical protein
MRILPTPQPNPDRTCTKSSWTRLPVTLAPWRSGAPGKPRREKGFRSSAAGRAQWDGSAAHQSGGWGNSMDGATRRQRTGVFVGSTRST